jgi:hypothetical protein
MRRSSKPNPTTQDASNFVGTGERGAGHLKAIIFTLLLASLIYVGFKIAPPLINEYQFQDGMQTIARFASVNRDSNQKIRDAILKEAQKDDVPVQADDLKIEGEGGNIRISADYSVTADLGVYQWTLNFHPKVKNDALF